MAVHVHPNTPSKDKGGKKYKWWQRDEREDKLFLDRAADFRESCMGRRHAGDSMAWFSTWGRWVDRTSRGCVLPSNTVEYRKPKKGLKMEEDIKGGRRWVQIYTYNTGPCSIGRLYNLSRMINDEQHNSFGLFQGLAMSAARKEERVVSGQTEFHQYILFKAARKSGHEPGGLAFLFPKGWHKHIRIIRQPKEGDMVGRVAMVVFNIKGTLLAVSYTHLTLPTKA